jgi:hypothetical protein
MKITEASWFCFLSEISQKEITPSKLAVKKNSVVSS